MRFLLYNLRYCAGTARTFNLPFPGVGYLRRSTENLKHITEFVRSLDPDIVGLVEVDSGSFRSRKQNQASVIARALGHYHVFESKYDERSLARSVPVLGKQVNAFLTRDTIKNEKFHFFKHGVKRLVIELELENLSVFLVHLALTFRIRHSQLADLYKLVKDVKKPHVVAGDFNALWGTKEMELFLAATGLQNAGKDVYYSYPSWAPRRQLDFILHSKDIRVSDFQIPRVLFSDHLPLVCDFEVKGGGRRAR
jgi:endonuclease/exonuclease/phosphatase family metal-dependent hydrolase